MNGKRNELKTSRLVLSTKADPFANMVYKANKPPSLKPVYIKSSPQILKPYKSEEKLTCSREFLPPISPPYQKFRFFDHKSADRATLRTPNFKLFYKKPKLQPYSKPEDKNELSFGEIEENVYSVKEKLSKYK